MLAYLMALEKVGDWDEQKLIQEFDSYEDFFDIDKGAFVDAEWWEKAEAVNPMYCAVLLKLALKHQQYACLLEANRGAFLGTDKLYEAVCRARERASCCEKYAWTQDVSEELLENLSPELSELLFQNELYGLDMAFDLEIVDED